MNKKEEELQPIAKKDAVKKYVAVVYHQMGCQKEGVISIETDSSKSSKQIIIDQCKPVFDVPDYFILSLFSIVIFIPTGLPAIVNSLRVRKALEHSDTVHAVEASNLALQYALVAIFTGPLIACAFFLIVFLPMYGSFS